MFSPLIPGKLNNHAYYSIFATVRDLDNQNPYFLDNNPLLLYQNSVEAPLFYAPTKHVLKELLPNHMNEINKPAELILDSEQSKRVSLTITSSVPSKQKKSVTEDLKVEVTFSKSADYTENQPSKSTDVPGKTKQQSLLSKIHSEEKSKSAEKEELTWSLMGGKSGKNSRTGNL